MPSVLPNPFRQSARQWQIRIEVDREHVPAVEEAFAGMALSVSSFEIDEAASVWGVEILTDVPAEKAVIKARLALISGLLGTATPHFEIEALRPRDWISEVEKSFPPFSVGRFYIHGSRIAVVPPAAIGLWVGAGAAFGSGEHATTRGCLLALDRLAKRRTFLRPLDMGCGSGILAIAMAKLWRRRVVGIDIDPVSIQVARENAGRNKVSNLTHFAAGDGYCSTLVRKNASFDLIVANILARPLARMAPLLAHHLAPHGVAILSGLLASQERYVLAAHRAQGLRLLSRISSEGWNTLILTS